MHFHDKDLSTEALFNSFTYQPVYHGHMFALLVMHVAAHTVVHDERVYFLSDNELATVLSRNLDQHLKGLTDRPFKNYIDS